MSPLPLQVQPPAGQITLRYWAAARAATGVAEESVPVPGPLPLAQVVAAAVARHGGPGSRSEQVLSSCSVLLGDRPVTAEDPTGVEVTVGQTVEFLPPFAGG